MDRYVWFNPSMGAETGGAEWPAMLDVAALMADGWNPVPFREFIIKIHSRCDLACDYCYMYEMADQSWRDQPRRMSREIAERTATRIGEHARAHGLRSLALILHGGEPLLAGRDLISYLVTAVRAAVGPGVLVHVSVQTNAVGLDDSYLQLFDELGIRVGVSLDGAAEAHDRHRRFASGRGSHAAVTSGLLRLTGASYRHLFSGLLCTIDIRNDPISTYQALAAFEPPKIDFLLPHGTWASPPPGRVPGAAETPYADWLITIFDHWYPAPRTRIRLFEEIMHVILGGTSATEMLGLAPSTLVVIETDGAIEQGDTLKVAYHGAPETGLHVTRDRFDDALLLPGVAARQIQERGLSAECRACHIRQVCGGGLYAHRYRVGTGFANPSVYCPDLMRLISHIHNTMQADIRARLVRRGAS
ncbi:MAG: uncharacterized protein QOJ73_7078 [Streptosporangiaceae bacterium]|jgi:uncharacterized protein|nr:uncharacterized protein [Streptosporangiaceae bacterium]